MGFLRKVFKKVGRGIKKAFKSFGKFMGKIGILGQVAMMFILPGIGNALASGLGSALGLQGVTGMSSLVGAAGTATSAGTGLLGSSSAILQGAGKVLQFAGKVASMPGKVFSSITKGVTSTLTEFSKTALSKIAPNSTFAQGAAENFFFGADSAASRVGKAFKSPFTDEAVAKVAGEIADAPTIDTTTPVETVVQDTVKPESSILSTPADPLVDTSIMSPNPTLPDSAYLEQQRGNYLERGIEEIQTRTGEMLTEKREALSDPFKATKAALGAITANQQEQDFAAQQAAMAASMSGEVINLGIYQDPGAFQTYAMQNTVAPIQGFQAPATYNAPISSWGQQFMFDPFNPQMARGIS
jgi:hypothetical protein